MFPENVGIPLGDPEGVTYYMLEVHFENPSLEKGKNACSRDVLKCLL